MRRGGDEFDFERWLAEFAFTPEATRRIASYCRRYGLRASDVDDVRQRWLEKLLKTSRGTGLPDSIVDAQEAMPYVLVAAKRAAYEMARRGTRVREDVVGPVAEPDEHLAFLAERDTRGSASLADVVLGGAWCEAMQTVLSGRLSRRSIRCTGCGAAQVVALAIHVVNTVCETDDGHGVLDRWTAEVTGGTNELGKLVYQAISQVAPDRVRLDSDHRLDAASRQFKRRCQPCVEAILLEAVEEVAVHTGTGRDDDTSAGVEAGLS